MTHEQLIENIIISYFISGKFRYLADGTPTCKIISNVIFEYTRKSNRNITDNRIIFKLMVKKALIRLVRRKILQSYYSKDRRHTFYECPIRQQKITKINK